MATIYRKYRPQVFDEVFGQEHIKETLTKALKLGRVAHAYLFTGARGVGKTTVARILAKAVNCLSDGPKPCGKCANCLAIQENRFIDLIEIDAASNRGIDEIRELRDKIQFTPSIGKKRVYIIDEVHMLTREAFNALLKTLEEPPEHTIFIFATTEAHKVPVTVLSRCQRFDFRLAGEDLVARSLREIAKKEGFKVDDRIIEMLARSSGGSFRDAQSLLDQLSSHLIEGDLSYEQALEILNLSSVAEIEDFIKVLEASHAKEAINFIARLKDKGVSFPDFLSQLVVEIRRRLIEKIKTDQNSAWENQILRKLIKAQEDMKFSPVESLPLELAAYEICIGEQNKELRMENTGEKGQNKESGIKNKEDEIKNKKEEEITDSINPKPEKITQSQSPKDSKQEKTEEKSEAEEVPTSEAVGIPTESVGEPKPIRKRIILPEGVVPINQDIKQAVVLEVSQKNKTLGSLLTDLSWGGDTEQVKIFTTYAFHKDKILDKKNLLLLENCLETVLQCKSVVSCEIKKDEDIAEEIESVFGE